MVLCQLYQFACLFFTLSLYFYCLGWYQILRFKYKKYSSTILHLEVNPNDSIKTQVMSHLYNVSVITSIPTLSYCLFNLLTYQSSDMSQIVYIMYALLTYLSIGVIKETNDYYYNNKISDGVSIIMFLIDILGMRWYPIISLIAPLSLLITLIFYCIECLYNELITQPVIDLHNDLNQHLIHKLSDNNIEFKNIITQLSDRIDTMSYLLDDLLNNQDKEEMKKIETINSKIDDKNDDISDFDEIPSDTL